MKKTTDTDLKEVRDQATEDLFNQDGISFERQRGDGREPGTNVGGSAGEELFRQNIQEGSRGQDRVYQSQERESASLHGEEEVKTSDAGDSVTNSHEIPGLEPFDPLAWSLGAVADAQAGPGGHVPAATLPAVEIERVPAEEGEPSVSHSVSPITSQQLAEISRAQAEFFAAAGPVVAAPADAEEAGEIAESERLVQTAPDDIQLSAVAMDEGLAPGSVVARISGHDADPKDVLTFSIADDPDGLFEVVGDELRLREDAVVDFESAGAHEVVLKATDAAGNVYTERFGIRVNDLNDAPVAGADVVQNLTEGAGAISGQLSATDADDGATVTYVISAGSIAPDGFSLNQDGSWSFDPTDSAYRHLGAGDSTVLTIPVTVTDDQGATDTAQIQLTVTGTNDAPVAGADVIQSVAEGAGAISGQLTATDADDGATATFTISDGSSAPDGFTLNPGGSWSFDPTDSAYQHLGAGDSQVITVPVTVTDDQGATDTAQIQLTLTGTNDAPVAGADVIQSVAEGAGAISGQLSATDADDGATATYTVSDGSTAPDGFTLNPDGSWSFDPTDSAYQHLGAGDSAVLTIPVTVTDDQGATDTAQIQLTVTGTNDGVSLVVDADASANTVVENAANGTQVGITATADDVDGDNVSFSLVDADGHTMTDGPFAVDATTGVVTVRDGSQLDYETRTSHDIHVKASSADGSSSTRTFTVAVADVDENHAPDAVDDSTGGGGAGTVLASENFNSGVSGWGSQVSTHNGQMAIGKDESATKTFSFGAEHANQAVVIEFDLVASENDPHHGGLGWDSWGDKRDYFSVTVNGMQEARDSYGDGQTDNIAVHYRVETTTDANGQVALDLNLDATGEYEVAYIDNFSIAAGDDWTAPLSTDEDVGLTIQTADLLGNDSDVDGDSLTIASVQDASHGTVVLNDDGSITFTPDADYHGDAGFSYTVSDGQGGSDTAQVALNVDAVNDSVSVVTDADASANTVVENAADGTEVGITATADDVDGDNVSFSLVDADGHAVSDGPFAVDESTGVVTVRDGSQLDYETQTSHEIHIQASSADGSSSTRTFTVGVSDAVYGGDGDDTFVYDPAGDVGYFDGGTGGGWTDVIDLSDALAEAADPENPWTIMVDGEHVEFDIASHALELTPDTSGVVELADGSELAFHGVEKIEW